MIFSQMLLHAKTDSDNNNSGCYGTHTKYTVTNNSLNGNGMHMTIHTLQLHTQRKCWNISFEGCWYTLKTRKFRCDAEWMNEGNVNSCCTIFEEKWFYCNLLCLFVWDIILYWCYDKRTLSVSIVREIYRSGKSGLNWFLAKIHEITHDINSFKICERYSPKSRFKWILICAHL